MNTVWFALLLCTGSVYTESPKGPISTEDAQWIIDLGGSVTRDAQSRVIGISFRGTWVEDTDLRRLKQFAHLSVLDLSLTHITDGGMQEIKNLAAITDFNLYFAEYVT